MAVDLVCLGLPNFSRAAKGMPVFACICAAVTTSHVETAILAGARTVDEIGDRCQAGTGCGSCHERLQDMLDEAASRAGERHPLPASA